MIELRQVHKRFGPKVVLDGVEDPRNLGAILEAAGSGLDPAQLLEILDSGAVSNPMFRLKGPQIAVNKEFPTAFPLKHMQKDLRLALRLAEQANLPLFGAATDNELFKEALPFGLGDADFAAVNRVIRKS